MYIYVVRYEYLLPMLLSKQNDFTNYVIPYYPDPTL